MDPEEPRTTPPERAGGEGTRFERLVLPFVRNTLFFPVTAVIAGNLAFAVAISLIYLLRERAWVVLALLAGLVFGSVKLVRLEIRDTGRAGPMLAWVLVVWAAGGVLTWALFDWL